MAESVLQQLPQLEAMCEQLYMAQTPEVRINAENALKMFGKSTEYIPHCKTIMDNSRSPYAQLLATSSLLKLVTEHTLSPQIRVEMKTYFLAYLDSHGPGMAPFAQVSLIQLLARTVKLGWLESEAPRALVDECRAWLERGSPGHYLLALRVLHFLVQEMNSTTPGRSLTQHRKVAVSFRDLALLKVFTAALNALRHLADSNADTKLKEQALLLAKEALSFDFVGTCLDESTEDLSTIQVPSSWRPLVEDASTLKLLFEYYGATKPPLSSTSLECLVRLASVRRSLFGSESERSAFLNRLVNGTRDVLVHRSGLGDHQNYHEFCRLLGRLKTNYQLSELVGVENYMDWIQLVAQLTIDSLNSWQWAAGSVYYLLGLWSRLVSSVPYLKGDAPSQLEANVPRITRAYITSRLESVGLVLQQGGSMDELLEGEEQLSEQLESLPYLVRFQYEKSAAFICSLLDPFLETFKGATHVAPASAQASAQLAVLEGQLAWLVSVVASVLRGRLSAGSAESQEGVDGELAGRVFDLVSVMDKGNHAQRYPEVSRKRLDMAVLGFFQSFRKVFIGEQVMHSSRVYLKLGERVGLTDHTAVLQVMLGKVAMNLKTYGDCEALVHLTLQLFQDLAAGYMSGKLLLKLEAVTYMLSHHTSQYYTFLDCPANSRNRTAYYATLARLLFMDDSASKFRAFVVPLHQVFLGIAAAASTATSPEALRSLVPQATVVGLFRDLRGIASATSSRRTYTTLFEWLYPQHMPAVLRCLEAWSDVPGVTTPLLKFVSEFCFNKSQRLTFDSSSPNGILLFREVSKVLVAYGTRVLRRTQVADAYTDKYKGSWVCLQALARALSGNYVNFGVFELYGDPALTDALNVAMQLVLAMPLPDIMAYKKVSKAYFSLLEVLAHNHTSALCRQPSHTFAFLLSSLDQGLKSLDVMVSSSAASAVDNLATFYFKSVLQQSEADVADGATAAAAAGGAAMLPPPPPLSPGAAAMQAHVAQQPGLLPELLRTLFEVVLFEECSNQWSLSRPMHSLILVNEAIYTQLKQQLVLSQPPERQQHLSNCLEKLMADVHRNLEPKNRDKFTQNLTVVRHEYRSLQ